ncbi:MAG TPA: class I SAM-dependent methyltransferase [Planctomycetes bacterium]|nr:class I SAM-dependent methyltransferase [Planctomycetota bacterium]
MSEAATWDGFAGRYERIVRLFDRSYPRIRELLRRDLAGRRRALEVAAGTGQFTFTLAEVAEDLLATDVSPAMVAQLQAHLTERGLKHVRAEVMSAYELPLADGSRDAILCANALHVMEQPRRALSEFRRVLAPGGLLAAPTFCHGVDLGRRLLSRFLSVVSPFVAHTRFSPTSLSELLAAAGFSPGPITLLPGLFPIAYLIAERT